ncbi:MAG: yufO [Paenibacillaceae bacterium]|jgi:simple sugar transport system ATP-binding protein|nr:yufO [Paenibacillaceae bacterium]
MNRAAEVQAAPVVVEMRGVTKRFPGITANDSITLELRKGEIHALLGENGAGKSTLMNILFGLYQPDEGEILVNGEQVVIDGPNKAIKLGIGMVHQHFKLVHPFTVAENIILGSEPRKGLATDIKKAAAEVERLSNLYGLQVDPNARIEDISVGMQQRVEILKTLYRGADIIIFDEPTAVLIPQEIEELLGIMRNLTKQGKSIILITHKLKEIMAISDRVTIIRRGKVVGSVRTGETSPTQLAEAMVGRNVSFDIVKSKSNVLESMLDVQDVEVRDARGLKALKGISFQVRGGEILGVAGVDGNGQSELIQALTGLRKVESGRVILKGRDATNKTPRAIAQAGLSLIPEDRHKHGLVLDFSLRENMVLNRYFKPPFNKNGFIHEGAMEEHARRLIADFDVRASGTGVKARSLSGGNQQKAIIARELDQNPDVLIAAQPTRGLDVGAIEFIHKRLVELRNKGKAVILVSFELEEIMKLSDRIIVMYEGRVVGEVRPEDTDDQELGLLMAGSRRGEPKHE